MVGKAAAPAPAAEREWRFRPPPRGLTPDQYLRCPAEEAGHCEHDKFCIRAHSAEELAEWVERFDPKKLLAALGRGAIQARVEADWRLGAVLPPTAVLAISPPFGTTRVCRSEQVTWRVAVTAGSLPEALGLLDAGTRPLFELVELRCEKLTKKPVVLKAREWTCKDKALLERSTRTGEPVSFEVTVQFSADVYGRYRQRLALVFPHHAPMLCWLEATVAPRPVEKLVEELRDKLTVSERGWTEQDAEVVPFSPNPSPPDEQDRLLAEAYPAPAADLAPPDDSAGPLTAENYAERSGVLLRLEEAARARLLHAFNVTAPLRLMAQYGAANDTTVHHARPGELFARLATQQRLSADTAAGRLILDSCQRALLCPTIPGQNSAEKTIKRKVYEVVVTAKAKNEIVLRLSTQMVAELSLQDGSTLHAAVRFRPNRQWSCEMQEGCKLAARAVPQLLFPDVSRRPVIPWNPASHWRLEDEKLNPRQKEAINAMTATVPEPLPPVLVLGPYGTGKTYTMAHGVKHILSSSEKTRVLICTHSNSAADLYVSEYLSAMAKQPGGAAARPLRVYYCRRRLGTVPAAVRPFTLRAEEGCEDEDLVFRRPTAQDVLKHRVVVCTLSITKYLTWLELPGDTFSHILVDEAAQALEWETARVLSLAGPETRFVLAGDHLQLAPDVYSEVCRERQFGRSLLERLQQMYGAEFPCAITLHENYRSHADIVQLTSELFYGRRLRARAHPGRHPDWPPVTVFSARGKAVQAGGDTGYCNNEEVYEVADRVAALCDDWPDNWGPRDEGSICVVAAYAEQVQKIRGELRNRNLAGVTVERLLNVQGKEFRAVFVSTVRTRDTCTDPGGDYGFLSDCKLLNTAVTRARSLAAVVCCPETVCSVGACSRYWEAVLAFAAERGGLFGTTEAELCSQLGAAELQRLHGLNPLAPTFRPQQPVPPPLLQPHQQTAIVPPAPATVPTGLHHPAAAVGPPLVPWMAGMVHPQLPYGQGMPFLSPGMFLGRPLLLGGPAGAPPLLPMPTPAPQLLHHLTNGHGHIMRAPGRPRLPIATSAPAGMPAMGISTVVSAGVSPVEEDALFQILTTTDVVSLLPPDVNLQFLLEDTRSQQEWAAALSLRRGPLFAQLFAVLMGRLRPNGVIIEERSATPASPASASASSMSGRSSGVSSPASPATTAVPASRTSSDTTSVSYAAAVSSSGAGAGSAAVSAAEASTTPVSTTAVTAAAAMKAAVAKASAKAVTKAVEKTVAAAKETVSACGGPISPLAKAKVLGTTTSESPTTSTPSANGVRTQSTSTPTPTSTTPPPPPPPPLLPPPGLAARLEGIPEEPTEQRQETTAPREWSPALRPAAVAAAAAAANAVAAAAAAVAVSTAGPSPPRISSPRGESLDSSLGTPVSSAQSALSPSQRSLPLYLRGQPPPPPAPAVSASAVSPRSYAAAVRRSLEPPPAGLAALPSREQHAHGYSHF